MAGVLADRSAGASAKEQPASAITKRRYRATIRIPEPVRLSGIVTTILPLARPASSLAIALDMTESIKPAREGQVWQVEPPTTVVDRPVASDPLLSFDQQP